LKEGPIMHLAFIEKKSYVRGTKQKGKATYKAPYK